MKIQDLKVAIYADGADINGMLELSKLPYVKGFTTNPSLMKKAGIKSYTAFAKELVSKIQDKPISFEVFSDEFDIMEKEARALSSFAENVFVKIPVINSRRESCVPLIKKLSADGIKLNVTAVYTEQEAKPVIDAFAPGTKNILSVFAGRTADIGINPIPIMKNIAKLCSGKPQVSLLWASTREAYNIIEAEECGAKIITVPNSIIEKLHNFGKDLNDCSFQTVKTFADDIKSLGFSII